LRETSRAFVCSRFVGSWPENAIQGAGRPSAAYWAAALRCVLVLLAGLAALACLTGSALGAPVPAPPSTIDGPSPDIVGLSDLSIARDGTGGLVYLKKVSGIAHVFVSRLVGGTFQPPEQLDATLPGASSQPVIAAGNDGLLTIAFINAGGLYGVTRASVADAYGPATDLFAGAANPSLQMTLLGKAYVAFTATGAGGHDVRSAFFNGGQWALDPLPLDANPASDAGTGSGRPQVAASGDGVAIVAWGEGGHVYSRRVWGISPSVVFAQADVPSLGGWQEVSADEPAIGIGGDSSYASVAFHEVFSNGSSQQSRVLMRRLRASTFDPVTQPDGISTPSTAQADQPALAVNEYGRGFVSSVQTDSNQLFATHLGTNGAADHPFRFDSLHNSTLPYATPATAGLTSNLIAWQQDSGVPATPEIRVRYAADGSNLGPELVLSTPTQGATDAADGLSAAGDASGNAAVAWVQRSPVDKQIVVDQMYQPPSGFVPNLVFGYLRTSQPTLSWTPARDQWGPIRYIVSVDGVQVAQTFATSLRLPAPLADGPHSWAVTAVNPAGLTSVMRPASFWIDTVPPQGTLTLTGKLAPKKLLHAHVSYTDAPPPVRPASASGVVDVLIKWGDGSSYHISHGKFHAYERAGRYTITVVITDRAGNSVTLREPVKIAAPKPRPKRGGKPPAGKHK
jgi:hypothetical protein